MEPNTSSSEPESHSRQTRQLALAARLRPDRWRRAEDLADTFGVSVRTVYRDMEALAEAGVPMVAVPGKGYRLEADAEGRVPTGGLPPGQPEADRATEAPPAELQRAVAERQAVRFRSGPPGSAQATPRRLDPYALARRAGRWVLIGYDHQQQKVRHVRLDATAAWEPLSDATFERPASYGADNEEVLPRDQLVRVRFAPPSAERVRRAPPLYTERVEAQGEAVILTLRVRRLAEIVPWLLGWGAQARVLAPATLRRQVADEARRLAAQYEDAPAFIA